MCLFAMSIASNKDLNKSLFFASTLFADARKNAKWPVISEKAKDGEDRAIVREAQGLADHFQNPGVMRITCKTYPRLTKLQKAKKKEKEHERAR